VIESFEGLFLEIKVLLQFYRNLIESFEGLFSEMKVFSAVFSKLNRCSFS